MKKHFRFAGFVVVCWFVSLVIWFPLFVWRVGATEHARMFNEYVPTTYDRVLAAVGYVLFAPVALAHWFIPSVFHGVEARDMIGLLLFNISVIGVAALLLSIVCHKFKGQEARNDPTHPRRKRSEERTEM